MKVKVDVELDAGGLVKIAAQDTVRNVRQQLTLQTLGKPASLRGSVEREGGRRQRPGPGRGTCACRPRQSVRALVRAVIIGAEKMKPGWLALRYLRAACAPAFDPSRTARRDDGVPMAEGRGHLPPRCGNGETPSAHRAAPMASASKTPVGINDVSDARKHVALGTYLFIPAVVKPVALTPAAQERAERRAAVEREPARRRGGQARLAGRRHRHLTLRRAREPQARRHRHRGALKARRVREADKGNVLYAGDVPPRVRQSDHRQTRRVGW